MPYRIVETKEYECIRCKYKWINRKNGDEKPAPKYCPSCKSSLWNNERANSTGMIGTIKIKRQRKQYNRRAEEHHEEQGRHLAELLKRVRMYWNG
jgi:hypothetical protein